MPDYRPQIRNLEDLRRGLQRDIDNIRQNVKTLERRVSDLKRVPGTDRDRANLQQQARQSNREVDRRRGELRTIERQLADLKRIQR